MAEEACQIQLCIPAMQQQTHFNLVRLFLRRTMSTQHWSRVEMSQANTSTDGECDRNVRFEIVGDLVQTSKNCDAKHERSTLLQQISTMVGTSLEGDVGTYSGGNLGIVTY